MVKHYLVAMNFKKRRLTIDGKVYLDNLYELVEVRSSLVHYINSNELMNSILYSTIKFRVAMH